MTNLPKELQEIRANVDILVKKYQKIKADMPATPDSCNDDTHDQMMNDMQDTMYKMISYVHQRISNLEDTFYNYKSDHAQNHLPNPSTPSDMQMCLDALGLSKDYDVKKRTVYASMNDGKGILFDLVK